MATNHYSFGDTPTAARRLELLFRVFEPEMRAFLTRWSDRRPSVALDLGCGPGHTTDLLAEVLRPIMTIGLDTSESFLDIARRGSSPAVTFLRHDVRQTPFPTPPVGVMFAHFLMTHLSDPASVLTTWGQHLSAGGVILVDDVEAMETDHPILRHYIDMVSALVAHSGGRSHIGPTLAHLAPIPGLHVATSTVMEYLVRTGDAASMFRMNLETWRHNPFIVEHYPSSVIAGLANDLDGLRDGPRTDEIHWKLRQMAFTKAD